ncbi:MAG: hypothetical protein JNN30_22150 [Rhodanobacteraceae bacterium]|nr:hypothetical protein [Rhodanobacteraceae bacterium]
MATFSASWRQTIRCRWIYAGIGVALAGAALAAPAPAPTPGPSPEASGPEFPFVRSTDGRSSSTTLLVGLLINGKELAREVAVLDGELDGRTYIALGMLCEALGLHASRGDDAWRINTPIGEATLARATTTRIAEIDYVELDAAGDALGLAIRFDRSEFALRIQGAWLDQSTAAASTPTRESLPIDVHAPRANLSAWRSEVQLRHTGGRTDTTTLTELGGALGSGNWHLRYLDDLDNLRRIDEWGWLLDRNRSRAYLGHKHVTLSSLLPSFSLTGAQWAYTNRPELAFGDQVIGSEIVANRLTTGRQIQGDGPRGGVAELRANGRVVARTVVRLDGHYRFPEISGIPADAALEVALYRPASNDVPIRIEQVTLRASDDLLAGGTYVLHAGAGTQNNPLDDADTVSGGAGFARVRAGINPRLSIDAAFAHAGNRQFATAGAAVNLGRGGVWSGHLARSEDAGAAELLGEGARGPVFWLASLRKFEQGYFDRNSPARSDQQIEFGWQQPRLRASLIARDFDDPVLGTKRYVKPALNAQPFDSFWVSVRPDYLGDYSYAASWQPLRGTRLGASRYAERRQLDWQQELGTRFDLTAAIVDDDSFGRRNSLVLYRRPLDRYGWWWGVGALHARGRFGGLVDAGLELRPGLTARLQMQDDPLYGRSSKDSRVISLSLTADFAVTPSGLTRGAFTAEQRRAGGITAHVDRNKLPPGIELASLRGVGVLVNGQVRGELDAEGRALLYRLTPGVHRVELDAENLPIELNPADTARNVEVRAGSSTPLEFTLHVQLGCAGFAGIDAAGLSVRVLDGERTAATTRVSSIGYYRIDGLAPGRYRLQLVDGSGNTAVERELILDNRFLFQQDLIRQAEPPP